MVKTVSYILLICSICCMLSCAGKLELNKTGFEKLQTELTSKFGSEAYYTDLQMTLDAESAVSVLVTQTKEPSSMKQEQWLRYGGGEWEKQADVVFTVEGAEAKSFMFQLNKEVSLSTMSDLLEKSKAQLAQKKQVKNPLFVSAVVSSKHQMNSKETGIFYYITLLDAVSQKDYRFVYDLKGNMMNSLDEQ
jgi:hypothetical protein